MVRTEAIETMFGNMGLSLGSSPGPLIRQVPHPNPFFLAYKGLAIGDAVTVEGRGAMPGRVVEYRKKHMVRVELEDGDEIDVDASRVAVTEPATALDVSSSFQDAQAKAVAPLDPCFEELPPDQREELAAVLKFEAPSMEALAVLPRADDTVKVSDGDERFWTLVRKVDGDRVEAIVINTLIGGQPFDKPGSKIAFEKRHIQMMEVFLSPEILKQPSENEQPARWLGKHAAVNEHFKAVINEPGADEFFKVFMERTDGKLGVPVKGPEEVAEWLRAEAKTNPAILDGTGMTDPEDIGVMRMQPLDMITQKISANGGPMTEQRKKYCLMVYNNLMNMVIGPRIIAVVFDD